MKTALSLWALACSKRSDSGERCKVNKAMKSRGGLGREVQEPSPPPSLLFFHVPFYFAPLPTIWTPGTGYLSPNIHIEILQTDLNTVKPWFNEPRFNEPLHNEVLGITNHFLQPGQNYSKMYGTEPRFNDLLIFSSGQVGGCQKNYVWCGGILRNFAPLKKYPLRTTPPPHPL